MTLDIVLTSLRLAAVTSLILLLIALPMGWWLSRGRSLARDIVSALTSLPIVLPPTVIGFYLLLMMGPDGPLAPLLRVFGMRTLAFTFTGLVVGSVIYSFPFALQPLRASFEAIPQRQLEAAASLGASSLDRFLSIGLPLARTGILSSFILSFAHTIGEFGVVLMIGGNIPGRTQVFSTAIFDAVEGMDWRAAHEMSLGLVAFSFVVVAGLQILDRRARADR